MTKDNSTGKDKEFYDLGKKMFDRIQPVTPKKAPPMPLTKPPLYRQTIPLEDQGKVITSRYYSVKPETHHLGMMLNPYYKECNLRIDWGVDGGIYKVEWQND
jgi:hypothetical protein